VFFLVDKQRIDGTSRNGFAALSKDGIKNMILVIPRKSGRSGDHEDTSNYIKRVSGEWENNSAVVPAERE
jgi:hypothetical protein